VARKATDSRSFCAARLARCSWMKSSVTLSSTSVMMMKTLAASPVAADTALAASSTSTSGLRKRARNCSASGRWPLASSVLGPW